MESFFKKNKNFLKILFCFLLIVIPVFLVFKNIFLSPQPFGGDAPFFWPENFKELISEPPAWTHRGLNFGGVNPIIWIAPLMVVYGFIESSSAALYAPAIILAVVGPFVLATYLGFSKRVAFFSSLFYVLNTYFIMLIDGGQAGFALAYGLFPLSAYLFKKYLDKPTINSFFLNLISLFVLGIADPRVVVICFIFLLFLNLKRIVLFIPMVIAWISISMYWIVPLIKNGIDKTNLGISGVNLFSLLDSMLLFQPHFPGNEFGKLVAPPFYFVGIPILIFGLLVFNKTRKNYVYYFLFLVFAYISIGIPFIDKIPFGVAFRDASKFFIPLVLLAGILIGLTAERVNKKLFDIVIYVYLLFLILPAITGNLNFVLKERQIVPDLTKIYEHLKLDKEFYRTAWFSERPPQVFETGDNPGIDAKGLIKARPIAMLNSGEDVFNFLNNSEFTTYLKTFGIKYLILSGNPRNLTPDQKDIRSWNEAVGLIEKSANLKKLNWTTDIPVYELSDTYPKFYSVDKLYLVVGPDLSIVNNHIPVAYYFEDGKVNPRLLEGKSKDAAKIVFNNKDETDLAMSFLQKYFVSVANASKNQWAYYSSENYIKAKYELLIRGIKYVDFDYGLGTAFSTKNGEIVEFNFNIASKGDYILMIHSMNPENGETDFSWKMEELMLEIGTYKHTVENKSGIQVLNTVALVPKSDFNEATKLATNFVKHFGVVENDQVIAQELGNVSVSESGIAKYKFENPKHDFWIVMNESYHPLWKLRRGIGYFDSIPVYSMQNAFYIAPDWKELGIEFEGQKNVRWGIYWSSISIIVLGIIYLWKKSKKY